MVISCLKHVLEPFRKIATYLTELGIPFRRIVDIHHIASKQLLQKNVPRSVLNFYITEYSTLIPFSKIASPRPVARGVR